MGSLPQSIDEATAQQKSWACDNSAPSPLSSGLLGKEHSIAAQEKKMQFCSDITYCRAPWAHQVCRKDGLRLEHLFLLMLRESLCFLELCFPEFSLWGGQPWEVKSVCCWPVSREQVWGAWAPSLLPSPLSITVAVSLNVLFYPGVKTAKFLILHSRSHKTHSLWPERKSL